MMTQEWQRLYDAAKAVLSPRRISEYVTCGEVSAAVESKSGKIYTGVCVDTCSTLGICAERSAIFQMLANGSMRSAACWRYCPTAARARPAGHAAS